MKRMEQPPRHFIASDEEALISLLGKEKLIDLLKKMLMIRQVETRAEAAYLQGKIGGFFHSYIGQEAIQLACVEALGVEHWYTTTYRVHALALLLGVTPRELMAELFGRANGNALGRGGSMHLYADRLLGGFGIVGSQVPIAMGAAFSLRYQKEKDKISICFLGDGAVAQGAFHEALNIASLWNLPCLVVIENNLWGMGTPIEKAVCVSRLAEDIAPSYNMKGYSFDGMDFFNCYAGFKKVYLEMLETQRPILVECVTERFKGHSISDPALYRSKEQLKASQQRDPLLLMKQSLIKAGFITEEQYKAFEKEQRGIAVDAVDFADNSPWPELSSLEKGVYAK